MFFLFDKINKFKYNRLRFQEGTQNMIDYSKILKTRLNEITLPYQDKVFASSTKEHLDLLKKC